MSTSRRSTDPEHPTHSHLARSPFVALFLMASIALGGCFGNSSDVSAPATEDEHVGHSHEPLWVNGGFESDAIGTAPSGWTLQTNRNYGITDTRPSPQTLASLNLAAGGSLQTTVVGGATESQADPALGAAASLRFPKYGQRAARLNNNAGNNRNVNVVRQTMTVAAGDVDPLDGDVHVRFALAPVLENPNHAYTQQPYYYVELRNITRSTTLYQDFNTSAQPGVPWKTSNGVYYTDWQLVDIAPGSASLAIGDQVELVVVAAGCSLGGHWGRVYLDGVGSTIPGVYTWATGPASANAGSNITYTVNYRNGGSGTASAAAIRFATPPNTTFQSVSLGSPTCTAPAVGATGNVTCSLGNLAPGQQGSFTVTVQINAGTPVGTVVTAGNYDIAATGVSPLLGPKVNTTVTSGVTYADVGVSKTNGTAVLGWGSTTTYTITAANAGPSAASSVTVTDTLPAQLTGATWTCTGAGGGTCAASGSGNLNDTANLPVGASVTYTLTANVIAGSGTSTVSNTVTATVGGGVTDSNPANNTDADVDAVGTIRTVSLAKNYAAGGTVTSAPAAISCGTGCTAASGGFLDGSTVVLTAAPAPGATFLGWGGACAASGTNTACTLTPTADQNVTAAFLPSGATLAVQGGSAQTTVVNTAFGAALSVVVRDSGNNPVAGVPVAFAAPLSGASAVLSSTTAVTDASGIASITATANVVAGSYNATATIAAIATTVQFALTNTPGAPAAVSVAGGDAQSTLVDTAFAQSLDVLVVDAFGNPVPGATVMFTGTGAVGLPGLAADGSASTNASGHALFTATANTVAGGPYAVAASVAGVAAPASFALTNLPGGAASASVSGGGTQSTVVNTAFANALSVTVLDAFGNPVPGVTVAFAAPGSGSSATLSGASAITDAAGVASVTATANTLVGSYAVSTTIAGVSTAPSFLLTNTPGAAVSLEVTSGDGQSTTVATSFQDAIVVTARDAYGNVVPGALVTFVPPSSGPSASLDAVTVVTDANGRATVLATAGTRAGTYDLVARLSNPASAIPIELTNTPGAPASLAAVAGTSPQATQTGTPFGEPLEVVVLDAFGNPVPNAPITFSAPASGATAALSDTMATTDSTGHASILADAGTTVGSYFVLASVTGLAPVAFALTNLSAAALTISVVSGSGQSTEVATDFGAPLVAVVNDAGGAPVANALVVFTTTSAAASAALSTYAVFTDASGLAQVTATANTKSGSHQVTAWTAGAVSGAVFDLVNEPGAPVAIVVDPGSSPQRTTVDTDFARPLGLTVVDAHGNPVPGVPVTFALPSSGATGIPSDTTVVTDASGRATITVTASSTPGTYTVDASVSGIPTPASFSLENTLGALESLGAASGDRQSTVVGTDFGAPLGVIVRDGNGDPVVGETVTFTVPASGASATAQTFSVDTDANGLASLPVTANLVAGTYVVTASTSTSSAPATFRLTNLPDAPFAITASALATPQSQLVENLFARELLVTVTDAHGNPVPNAAVTYSAPSSGASSLLSSTSVVTDANGQARVSALANTIAGAYTVTASVNGVATPASFALSNLSGRPATIRLVSGGAQMGIAGQPFDAPVVFEVVDVHGNPVVGAPVTVQVPTFGASASCVPTDAITDAAGRVTLTCTANLRSGAYTATATAPGVAGPATVMLTNQPIPTTTTISVAPNPAGLGQTVRFTATVTAASGGTPAGQVRFTVDGTTLDLVDLVDGSATLDYPATVAGQYEVVAMYVPVDPHASSISEPATFRVLAGGVSGGAVCSAAGGAGAGTGSSTVLAMLLGVLGLALVRRRHA